MKCRTAFNDGLLAGFFGVFLSYKVNARRFGTAPGIISLSPLPLADRRDWRYSRGKWPLPGNPDRSLWPRHTSIKLFWPQPIAPWTAGSYGVHSWLCFDEYTFSSKRYDTQLKFLLEILRRGVSNPYLSTLVSVENQRDIEPPSTIQMKR